MVEADETYFGGAARNMRKSKREKAIKGTGGSGEVIVFGMLERGGDLRVVETTDLKGETLKEFVRKNVKAKSTVMTDEHRSFIGLDADYFHHTVNHSAGESPKHLGAYLAEMCYR